VARKSRHSDVKITVLAMGKHPAWPDFIDDLAQYPAGVVAAKDALWTRGLQRACQLGAFNTLVEASRVSFSHDALIVTSDGTCVARVWPSLDAKGAAGWPMIAMAHAEPVDASWLCECAPARLRAVQEMSGQTRNRQLVALSLGEAARQLEDTLALVVGVPRASVSDGALLAQADAVKIAAGLEAAREQLTPDARGEVGATLRLPRVVSPASPLENARVWAAALRSQMEPSLSLVAMERDDSDHVDVIIGHGRSDRWGLIRDASAKDAVAGRGAPGDTTLAQVKQLKQTLGARTRGATVTPGPDKASRRSVALLAAGGVLVLTTIVAALLLRSNPPNGSQPAGVLAEARPGAKATARPGVTEPREAVGDVVTAAMIEQSLVEANRESDAQGLAVPDDVSRRAREVIADGAATQAEAREAQRLLDAWRSELAGRVLAEVREKQLVPGELDEAQRVVADAWRTRLSTMNPREGMLATRERIAREEDGLTAALDALGETRPGQEIARDEPVLTNAINAARREGAMRLAELLREGGDVQRVRDRATALRRDVAKLRDDVRDELPPLRRVPVLQATARDALARGESWATMAPTYEALLAAATDESVRTAVGDELRRLEAVRDVSVLPADKLEPAMRAAATDTTGKRIAEIMQGWRALAATDDVVQVQATAYSEVVKPAIGYVPEAGARERLGREAATLARDAWLKAQAAAIDDEGVLAVAELAVKLDAQQAGKAPAWIRAAARLEAARLRRAIAESATDDVLLTHARELSRHVQAAGDALETWPDAKRLRALDVLAREAIAQREGKRQWLGVQGPGAKGWVTRDDGRGQVTFTSPAGTAVAFARAETEDAERVTYIARGECSVAAVIDAMRDDATRAEVDGLLWQFDDATDPRVGPRAWTRRNGVITPTREWHARINGREPLLAAGLTAGAPDASMPMNYVSAKAAEALAAAMGCRLPTQREWESVAGVASDAEQNRIDMQLLEQEAFAKRTGVRAARPAADTAWANGEGAADVPARDGALWLWPAEKGTAKARFANLGGNVAEWANTPVGPVIIGRSALTLHDGSAVRNTSSDALRGFADVGFRLAFDVAKELPTTDAIAELRSKGRQ
jgi:hypothetical protein